MKKLLLIFTALALTVANAADKTYEVTITRAASLNGATLHPGNYTIQLEGEKAVIKMGKTVVEAPAKLQNAEHKFAATSIYSDSAKANAINEIDIGGTTMRIVFAGSAAVAP